MTDDEMRIAIAEAMGLDPHDVCSSLWGGQGANPDYVDFLNDLNACHEMEKGLTDEQFCIGFGCYIDNLNMACGGIPNNPYIRIGPMIRATARQRAEAFLKTIGKWVE